MMKLFGIVLKCVWRKISTYSATFVAIWMKAGYDDRGYRIFQEDTVFKVFTIQNTGKITMCDNYSVVDVDYTDDHKC